MKILSSFNHYHVAITDLSDLFLLWSTKIFWSFF